MSRHYEIYRDDQGRPMAVPAGFSLAALLSWVWAGWLQLWVEAGTLFVINVAIFAALYANHARLGAFMGVQAALGIITGFNARRLRESAAERGGYAYLCTVPARNRAEAVAKLAQLGGEPLPEWRPRLLGGIPDMVPKRLRGILAVAALTLRGAFRQRLVVAVLALLLVVIFVLPGVIKHDGSARGFTQILITYTLGTITVLLGFTTLWLACGAIARDIEEMQLFLVASKPLPRWQIWFGKWLGIMVLNAAMVALSGVMVYGLVLARTHELSQREQKRLRAEILVSRGSAKEPPVDLSEDVNRAVQEKIKANPSAKQDIAFTRKQIEEGVKVSRQYVPPGHFRRWEIDLGPGAADRFRARPLYIRTKFFTSQGGAEGKNFAGTWIVGPIQGARRVEFPNSLAAESFVEFLIPPFTLDATGKPIAVDLIDSSGKIFIDFQNWNDEPLLFPLDDGLEVLYPEGSFAMNYARGLCVIVAWLGLLTSIGLAGSSLLSFPVAAFCAMGVLVLGFSGNTLKSVVDQGGIVGINHDTGQVSNANFINQASVLVYGAAKDLLDKVTSYSPVGNLSTGRAISWEELAMAVFFINILLGGLVSLFGMVALTRRELAAPTKF